MLVPGTWNLIMLVPGTRRVILAAPGTWSLTQLLADEAPPRQDNDPATPSQSAGSLHPALGLPEGAPGLQGGVSHRVPQLFEEDKEQEAHEEQQNEQEPQVEAEVPAPAQSQGQRGGRHQVPPGGGHGG